jgi:murein L,D-transpeptidase YafK
MADDKPCVESYQYIEVIASESELFLCENGRALKTFKVSLDRGGLEKKMQGDGKTPIGNYSLGIPRSSNRFFVFIPIGYPNEKQKVQGFTGSDVGLHGPIRDLSWLGKLNTWINWTNGCVAVGSEHEIFEISDWVKSNQGATISIH